MAERKDPNRRYRKYFNEDYEQRCQRRLQDDLGINAEGVEMILQMRRQLMELQAQIQELEAELNMHMGARDLRLSRYREVYFEATWTEPEED
ncbi:MAG: hypothetical protein ACM3PY_21670 [Omnitrophica WOR_2 bacterium]